MNTPEPRPPSKPDLTWDDIERDFRESLKNSPGESDQEKLDYFKKKLLRHLDTLQAAEDKKIKPFPIRKTP
jgi:hypothetical protein